MSVFYYPRPCLAGMWYAVHISYYPCKSWIILNLKTYLAPSIYGPVIIILKRGKTEFPRLLIWRCPEAQIWPQVCPNLTLRLLNIVFLAIICLLFLLFRRNIPTGQVPSNYEVWIMEKQRRLTQAVEGKKFPPHGCIFLFSSESHSSLLLMYSKKICTHLLFITKLLKNHLLCKAFLLRSPLTSPHCSHCVVFYRCLLSRVSLCAFLLQFSTKKILSLFCLVQGHTQRRAVSTPMPSINKR